MENLYYRHYKAATATPSGLSPSTLRKGSIPSTPNKLINIRSSIPAANSGPHASKQNSSSGQDTDVFGGLMTPPASGNTFPLHSERQSFGGNPSFASGLLGRQRSPTAGLEGKGASSGSAANKGKSYADFWSKIGTAGAGQGIDHE